MNNLNTHLNAFSDRLVIDVQEARSRCRNFEQNLLRLVHVLEENRIPTGSFCFYLKK